jgi:hypothetical protein
MSVPQFDLCKYLRWKTHARETGDPTLILESLMRSQVPFSCLKTCGCVGPDDDIVTPELCSAARECFVRDPQSGGERLA